jgi:hypothetical protein
MSFEDRTASLGAPLKGSRSCLDLSFGSIQLEVVETSFERPSRRLKVSLDVVVLEFSLSRNPCGHFGA